MALRRKLVGIVFTEFVLISVCYAGRTDSGNWTSGAGQRTPQTTLYLDLMDGYGPRTPRPVFNESDQIKVGIGARPASLIGFDEREQKLTLQISLQLTWTDKKLTWDPNDYNGLQALIINTEDIWVPDVILLESIGGTFSEVNNGFAEVTYEGNILWYDVVVAETFCKVLIRYFPFDVQHCNLTFTSWNYNLSKIDFYYAHMHTIEEQLEQFVVNGLWQLSDLKIEHINKTFSGVDELWPSVRYVVEFERTQASFYATNILFPCILLSLMNLLVFVLPTDSGEKVSFVMTNVLTLVLFQQLVASMLPPSGDDTPIFSLHIFWMIVFGSIAIVWTVLVIIVYFEKKNYPQKLYNLLTSFRCLYHNLSFGRKEASTRKYVILTKSRQLLYGDLDGSQFKLNGELRDEEMDHQAHREQENGGDELEMHPLADTIERWTDDGIKIYKATSQDLPLDDNDAPEPRVSLTDKIRMVFCGHCGQVNATRLKVKKEAYSFDPKNEKLWQETGELLDKLMSYIMVFMTILVYFLLILRFAVHDPHAYRADNH